jgi:ribosomal protein S18 acetylase RimI-like enzyme
MDEFIIREMVPQANRDDLNLLLPAYLKIWNDPENLKYLSITQKPFEEKTVSLWFSNHLIQGGHYYAAIESGNRVSGIIVVKINPIEGFEIFGIGVLPNSKGNGIGTRLLNHAVSVATTQGFKAIDILVFVDNFPMLQLLLSLSFIPIRIDYNRRADGIDILALKKYL